MTQKIDLTIIIVNYNARFWLKQTLESLKKFYLNKTNKTVKVVVVDNHSQDDSVTMIKRHFRFVELIALSKNLGFAAANNIGIKNSQSDYIMLLNSDVSLTEKSNLDSLIQVLAENKKIGIIGPKLILTNGQIDPACHRGEPTLWASFCYFFKLSALFPHSKLFSGYLQTYKDINTIHEVDAVSGGALMTKRSNIKKIGLLDERFFMYAEDLDWCKRFREKNLKILYYPLVEIIHHKHKSGIKSDLDQTKTKTKKYFYDTMLLYFDKHYAHQYPKFIRILLKLFINFQKGELI